jgi:hypothetical protein
MVLANKAEVYPLPTYFAGVDLGYIWKPPVSSNCQLQGITLLIALPTVFYPSPMVSKLPDLIEMIKSNSVFISFKSSYKFQKRPRNTVSSSSLRSI